MDMKLFNIALKSIEEEAETLISLKNYLNAEAFLQAVDAITAAPKIITGGCGNSGVAAKKLSHTLCCIERPSFFLSPAEAAHGGLGCINKGDVMVLVSRGGKTAELMPMIDVSVRKKAILIAVTENMDSPLAKAANIVLQLKINKETDKYNMMATASFVATIGLFDALMVAVMEKTGYKKETFGIIHPGGAVGARLNKK